MEKKEQRRRFKRYDAQWPANKRPMLRVVREYPASEKFRQLLGDYTIEFTANDTRNERGAVVKSTFAFPGEVKAHLIFRGNADTGNGISRIARRRERAIARRVEWLRPRRKLARRAADP